ncbi:hypothetical protein, partial [Bradyrhizobium sp. Leo121]|uniref:hypothetical protein n=1 Tax=Bradyrhizobium sp. Leo121 TaxID=1571195 RepID=UPI0010E4AE2F
LLACVPDENGPPGPGTLPANLASLSDIGIVISDGGGAAAADGRITQGPAIISPEALFINFLRSMFGLASGLYVMTQHAQSPFAPRNRTSPDREMVAEPLEE